MSFSAFVVLSIEKMNEDILKPHDPVKNSGELCKARTLRVTVLGKTLNFMQWQDHSQG